MALGTAEGVEDGVGTGTGERLLSVGGEAVGDDTTLLLSTCYRVSLSRPCLVDISQ